MPGGFAGLGAMYGGYEDAETKDVQNRLRKQQFQEAQIEQAGQVAFGRALQQYYGGASPAAPAAPLGVPPTGGQPGPANAPVPIFPGLQAAGARLGGMFTGGSQVPSGAMPGGPAGGRPPSPSAGPAAGLPAPNGPNPAGSSLPGPAASSPMPAGQLDWRNIVNVVARANPGAPPEVIAAAVNRFLPVMNQQSQMEWKQYALAQTLGTRERIAEENIGSRENIAGQNRQSREGITSQNIQSREKLAGQRTQAQSALETQRQQGRVALHPAVQAFDQFMKENPNATAEQQAAFIRAQKATPSGGQASSLLNRFYQEHPNATAAEGAEFLKSTKNTPVYELKKRDQQTNVNSLIAQVDGAITDLKQQGGAPVTGLAGRAARVGEFAGNTMGADVGTRASDFETKIRLIQQQFPRAIAGASRLSKDERDHLDQIIRGLGSLTSPPQAISALEYVKSVLASREGGEQTGAPAGPPGTARPVQTQSYRQNTQGPPPDVVKTMKPGIDYNFGPKGVWKLDDTGQPIQVLNAR